MMISEPTPYSHGFNFNDIKRIHPLSDASSAFFHSTSPVQPTTSNTIDDVTTIFVVGFPEDMAEREFQNMFTFCHGFEAASLKWHCKDQEEDNLPSNNGKKQMIGFARFRTRLEALESIEILNGKKIDGDKGTVLKAEMAKKNLHIKRSSATQTSTSTSSSTSSSTAATVAPVTTTATTTNSPSSLMMSSSLATSDTSLKNLRYDQFSHLPSDLLQDSKNDIFVDPMMNSYNDSLFGGIPSHSFDQEYRTSFSQHISPQFHLHPQQQQHIPQHQQQQQHIQSFPITTTSHRKLMNDDQEFPYLSKSTPIHEDHHDLMRLGSLSIQQQQPASRLPNPADQNPPCNTLYVGNLPPNTQEDELRHLFSICKGYRRMCFRTKPQGPMCFVEFDDIVFATQALSELQGHQLSNSVKGGIRLSYSKNPLFIKPNKDVMSFKQMGTALMSSDRRDFMFDPQL